VENASKETTRIRVTVFKRMGDDGRSIGPSMTIQKLIWWILYLKAIGTESISEFILSKLFSFVWASHKEYASVVI
jgi:hypothetical protein